ncbi:hypothetical protein LguiB_002563 [Lonicera macranthoides]
MDSRKVETAFEYIQNNGLSPESEYQWTGHVRTKRRHVKDKVVDIGRGERSRMWWSFTGETRSLEEKGVQRGTKVERGVERVNEKKLGKVFGPCDARASYEIGHKDHLNRSSEREVMAKTRTGYQGRKFACEPKLCIAGLDPEMVEFGKSKVCTSPKVEATNPVSPKLRHLSGVAYSLGDQRQQSGELNVLDWLRAMFGFQAYQLLNGVIQNMIRYS